MTSTATETTTDPASRFDQTCEHSEHATGMWHRDGGELYCLILFPCCDREPEPIILCGHFYKVVQSSTIRFGLECPYCHVTIPGHEAYICLGPVR